MISIENPLDAWLGTIPTGWEKCRLKYLFSIKKDIAGEEGYTVLSITQQGIIPKNMDEKGQFASDYSKYQLVNKGDFAMNHMDLLTGWVDISDYEGVTSPDYRVFVLNNKQKFCAEYYKYIFQLCYRHRIFYSLGQGVAGFGRWRLPADMFLNFVLPIPPYDEQIKIAEYLQNQIGLADKIIHETADKIDEYEKWKTSKIREIINSCKDDPESKRIKLKYLLTISSGSSKDKEAISDEGKWPVFGGGSLLGYSDEFNCTEENLLVGRVGSCGKVTRLTTNTWATDNALIITPLVDKNYLYYILVDANLKDLSTANAQPLVTGTKIKNHSVTYSSNLDFQKEVVKKLDNFCENIENLIREKQKLIEDLELYKTSIIYEMVTGKRRVV